MKVIFEVTDLGEARLLTNAARYKSALREMDDYLRNGIKHDDKPWQEARDWLWAIIKEYDLPMEDDYEPTEESGCACGRAPPTDGDGRDGDDGAVAGRVGRG